VLESVLLGAVGWVAGLVNAFPEETRLLWDLARGGRVQEAIALYRWFTPLLHLDTHVKLVQYIKLAMAERGFGSESIKSCTSLATARNPCSHTTAAIISRCKWTTSTRGSGTWTPCAQNTSHANGGPMAPGRFFSATPMSTLSNCSRHRRRTEF